jgi:nicotinamidase-related amidase
MRPPTPARSTTALVVVDMQEYFCRPDSVLNRFVAAGKPDEYAWFATALRASVIPAIARLIAEFRAAGELIVFTQAGSARPDGTDMPGWARRIDRACVESFGERGFRSFSDPACRVIDELAPGPDDLLVRKTTSGPLASSTLVDSLRTRGIDSVVVAGVMTEYCVTGVARELSDADFRADVVGDACTTTGGPSIHAAALTILAGLFSRVVTMDRMFSAT